MKTLAAKEAKYGFGRLLNTARAELVAVAKHDTPVVVVMAIEESERLSGANPVAERGVESFPRTENDPMTQGKTEK